MHEESVGGLKKMCSFHEKTLTHPQCLYAILVISHSRMTGLLGHPENYAQQGCSEVPEKLRPRKGEGPEGGGKHV